MAGTRFFPQREVPMTTTAEFYRERANAALDEANGATLDNVREQKMRAAKAWDGMAVRAERTAQQRQLNEDAKAAAAG